MLTNFIVTQCGNLCLQESTPDMKLMQICEDSSPVRTNLEDSKRWSCRTFNGCNLNLELSNFTQQRLRKRLIDSRHLEFVDIATQCLKQSDVSIITVLVKRHDLLELQKTINVELKREYYLDCGNSTPRRRFTLLSKSGNMNVGSSTRLMFQ